MKNFLGLLLLVIFIKLNAQQEMVLDGTYQGQNLYVQNPFASSGVGFCVTNVTVNGQQSIDEINSSAFEIDLASYQLVKGASVEITIEYKDDCSPRVLNPDVLRPTSTYVITRMNITTNGLLTFSTSNESGELPFIVEQKRWNKWIKVGTVKGKGDTGINEYQVKLNPHSGKNTFRIKQIDFSRRPRYSQEKRLIRSAVKEVFIANENILKISQSIMFTDDAGNEVSTMYEIFNRTGLLVKTGFGSEVDLSDLNKGDYFINYDNKMDQIKKV